MNTETVIIAIALIILFIGFELSSIRSFKKTISKQKQLIKEQEDFIKVLQTDYNFIAQKQFEEIKKKLTQVDKK